MRRVINAKALSIAFALLAVSLLLIAFGLLNYRSRESAQQFRDFEPAEKIVAFTESDGAGKHLGDKIIYRINVIYDQKTIKIDKNDMRNSSIPDPLKVLSRKENEYGLKSGSRMYVQEYVLQLVQGETDTVYILPATEVYYTDKNTGNRQKIIAQASPIFIAARFPNDPAGFFLQPIRGKVETAGYDFLAVPMGVMGGLILISVAVLTVRSSKRGPKTREVYVNTAEYYEFIASLKNRINNSKDPSACARTLYQVFRKFLAERELINWLSPDFSAIALGKREKMLACYQKCQLAFSQEILSVQEVSALLESFKEFLELYRHSDAGGV